MRSGDGGPADTRREVQNTHGMGTVGSLSHPKIAAKCFDLLSICQLVNGILVAGLPPAANSARPENEENTQAWVACAVSGAGAAGGRNRRIWPHSRDLHHGGSRLRTDSRHHRRLFPDRLLQI